MPPRPPGRITSARSRCGLLPLIRPTILAIATIIFLISFDEVVLSLFLIRPVRCRVEVFRHVDLRADGMRTAIREQLVSAPDTSTAHYRRNTAQRIELVTCSLFVSVGRSHPCDLEKGI
jgi:hypothetical protein